jgi:hypothetical protein
VSSPPDALHLASALLPDALLGMPAALSLAFSDLLPLLAIDGSTIAPFGADFAGTISATAVSEPWSIALLGLAFIGIGSIRWRGEKRRLA